MKPHSLISSWHLPYLTPQEFDLKEPIISASISGAEVFLVLSNKKTIVTDLSSNEMTTKERAVAYTIIEQKCCAMVCKNHTCGLATAIHYPHELYIKGGDYKIDFITTVNESHNVINIPLYGHESPVSTVCVIDKNNVISGSVNGKLYFWTIHPTPKFVQYDVSKYGIPEKIIYHAKSDKCLVTFKNSSIFISLDLGKCKRDHMQVVKMVENLLPSIGRQWDPLMGVCVTKYLMCD